jgi:hypothetical protein
LPKLLPKKKYFLGRTNPILFWKRTNSSEEIHLKKGSPALSSDGCGHTDYLTNYIVQVPSVPQGYQFITRFANVLPVLNLALEGP